MRVVVSMCGVACMWMLHCATYIVCFYIFSSIIDLLYYGIDLYYDIDFSYYDIDLSYYDIDFYIMI